MFSPLLASHTQAPRRSCHPAPKWGGARCFRRAPQHPRPCPLRRHAARHALQPSPPDVPTVTPMARDTEANEMAISAGPGCVPFSRARPAGVAARSAITQIDRGRCRFGGPSGQASGGLRWWPTGTTGAEGPRVCRPPVASFGTEARFRAMGRRPRNWCRKAGPKNHGGLATHECQVKKKPLHVCEVSPRKYVRVRAFL